MKKITIKFTIREERINVCFNGKLTALSSEEIIDSWESEYFNSPEAAFVIDIDENYEDTPRMFDSLEEAEEAFLKIRPASIPAEVVHGDEDEDKKNMFRNVAIWTLEKEGYDEDGQRVESETLDIKADNCIA